MFVYHLDLFQFCRFASSANEETQATDESLALGHRCLRSRFTTISVLYDAAAPQSPSPLAAAATSPLLVLALPLANRLVADKRSSPGPSQSSNAVGLTPDVIAICLLPTEPKPFRDFPRSCSSQKNIAN
ncbi:hypothetical protein ACLKA7_014750 [Drosophila subpalustris]